jgi:hypothetical protein
MIGILTFHRKLICSLFVWLVADSWCWFVLREKYCWLVAGGWFVLREKYCWLVADKPSEQGAGEDSIEKSTVKSTISVHLARSPHESPSF